MEEKFEKIGQFLNACDELVEGTHLGVEQRISQVLKALAASKDLTGMFSAVTQEFDYQAAKARCLRISEGKRGAAYLPTSRVEALAFVFCLLVEIDSGRIRLSDFLLRYFYVDGSYTASWSVFSERMLKPFRDIVREAYPNCTQDFVRQQKLPQNRFGLLAQKIAQERARLAEFIMSEENLAAGDFILSAACVAAGRQDASDLQALLMGYRYFVDYCGVNSRYAQEIFTLAAEL